MIIDRLENLASYASVNTLFKEVIDFIKNNPLEQLEEGKHIILKDKLFVNVTTAKGKTPDKAVMETHRDMIDIQIPLSDAETYGYTPAAELPDAPYDGQKDITKYPDMLAQSYITCQPGMFAIFFPQDGHAPCITMQPQLKKAIFKVKAE